MNIVTKKNYVTPIVEVIEVEVEKGFAGSVVGGEIDDELPILP